MATNLNGELAVEDLPSHVRRSFKGGAPRKLLLPPGTTLFTVSHKQTFNPNSDDGVPAFWSPYKPLRGDPGFEARVQLAKSGGPGADEAFTNLSAFFGRHAGGRFAVVARLKIGVYGFMGPIRRQGRSAAQVAAATRTGAPSTGRTNAPGAGKNLVGYHLYIPGLQGDVDISRVRKVDLLAL